MAEVVVSMSIMPESPSVDLKKIEGDVHKKIKAYTGIEEMRFTQEPIAFGLKALKILFVMNEAQGSTEKLEKELSKIDGVNSVEVTDVRRAIG